MKTKKTLTIALICALLTPAWAEEVGNQATTFQNVVGGKTIRISGKLAPVTETLVYDDEGGLMGRMVLTLLTEGQTRVTTYYKGSGELVITDRHTTNEDGSQIHEIYTADGELAIRTVLPADRKEDPVVKDASGKDVDPSVGNDLMKFPGSLWAASLAAEEQNPAPKTARRALGPGHSIAGKTGTPTLTNDKQADTDQADSPPE